MADENSAPNRQAGPRSTRAGKVLGAARDEGESRRYGDASCTCSKLLEARAKEQALAREELQQLVARLGEFGAARTDLSRLLWDAKQRADEVTPG